MPVTPTAQLCETNTSPTCPTRELEEKFAQLRAALQTLDEASKAFAQHVKHEALEVVIYRPAETTAAAGLELHPLPPALARERCAEAISSLSCPDGMRSRHLPGLTGVIALSDDGLHRARLLNDLKQQFETLLRAANRIDVGHTGLIAQPSKRKALRMGMLENWEWGDLHAQHAARPFIILDEQPRKLEFRWKTVRTVRVATNLKVREFLIAELNTCESVDRNLLDADLRQLWNLQAHEQLALIEHRNIDPKGHFKSPNAVGKLVYRRRSALLPYLVKGRISCAISVGFRHEKQRTCLDKMMVEDSPLLASLPIYRFTPEARQSRMCALQSDDGPFQYRRLGIDRLAR